MNLLLPFGISLIILVIGARFLVRFATGFSSSVRLSPLVIAATAIALGTSIPELFVSFSSILQRVSPLSTGDVIGSNIANIGLVLGLSILLFPMKVGTKKTQRNNIILVLLTLFFVAVYFLPTDIRTYSSLGLLIFYFVFLFLEIFWGEEGRRREDRKALHKMKHSKLTPAANFLGMGISLAAIGLSSKYLVSSAVGIAGYFNVENEIIGLSVVAIGTSLPELSTSIVAGFKKEWKLLFGDIQGSNIFNLAVVGTVLALFGQTQTFVGQHLSLAYLSLITIAVFFLTRRYSGKSIPRIFGLGFLLFYASYIFLLVHH